MSELTFPATLIVDHGCHKMMQITGGLPAISWGKFLASEHQKFMNASSHGYPHPTEVRIIESQEELVVQGLTAYAIVSSLTVRA